MWKITRIIVKRFWGLLALLLFCLAIVVVIGREITPKLDEHREQIAAYLSEKLQLQIEIGDLQARWNGLTPEVEIKNLHIQSQHSRTPFTLSSVHASMDFFASLFSLAPRWRELRIDGIELALQEDANRRWQIHGFTTANSESTFTLDDILQLSDRMTLKDAVVDVTFRSGHNTVITFPNLLVESRGSFHRFSTQVAMDGRQDVLNFVMETEGDVSNLQNITAKGYLKLQHFELDRVMAALPGDLWDALPDQEWHKGNDLSTEMWFDVFSGGHMTARGNLELGKLPVKINTEFSQPLKTTGQFVFQWRDLTAWDLSLINWRFAWEGIESPVLNAFFKSPDLGAKITMRLPEFNLGEWWQALSAAHFLPQSVEEKISTIDPRGKIKNVDFYIDAENVDTWHVAAELDDIAINPFGGIPGANNVTGYLQANSATGFVELNSGAGFALNFEKIYDQSLQFDQADGRVNWAIDKDRNLIQIYSDLLSVESDIGVANGYFSLDTPLVKGDGLPSELMLHIKLLGGNALHHKLLVPVNAPQSLRDWLSSSIQSGGVPDGEFIYRGGINKETAHQASIQLHLNIADVNLLYHPDWPQLHNASGEMWLNDHKVNAHLNSGVLLGSQLDSTDVEVFRTDQQLVIELSGSLQGPGQDGLSFLTQTPIREKLGDQLDTWKLQGAIKTDFELTIPFENQHDPDKEGEINYADTNSSSSEKIYEAKQKITANFDDANLLIEQYNIKLDDIKGRIQYRNDKGLYFKNLKTTFLNRDVRLSMAEQENDADMVIDMKGVLDSAALADWSGRPELKFLAGQSDFNGLLTIPKQKNQSLQLKIESSLTGIEVDLPAEVAKTPEEAIPFFLKASFSSESVLYDIGYDNLRGLFELQHGRLNNASVSINSPTVEPKLRDSSEFFVKADFDRFDWNEWLQVYERYREFNGGVIAQSDDFLPIAFEMHSDEFVYSENVFSDMEVAGKQGQGFWLLEVQSPLLAGEITWFQDQQTATVVDLDYLKLPARKQDEAPLQENIVAQDGDAAEDENTVAQEESVAAHDEEQELPKEDVLKDFDPSSFSAIDFVTQSFAIGEEEYGSWSFQMRPVPNGVQLSNIVGNVRGGHIIALPKKIADVTTASGAGAVNATTNRQSGSQKSNNNRPQRSENKPEAEAVSKSATPSGATLLWTKKQDRMETVFSGRFLTETPAEVFKQWKQPQAFESDLATFDANLSWQGSPAAIELKRVSGDLEVNLTNGEFLQAEAGAANDLLKLFSLFNFDTWARRLRFDFSDLYGTGLDFDQVNGRIKFNDGTALIVNPVVVESPSSRMQLAGSIDLYTFEIDGTLVARLPVGENLTWVAFFAGGLPAAVGTYMVSKIFKKQVDKLASLSYSIQGTVNDPNMKFERLFDHEAAERQGKESEENLNKDKSINTNVEGSNSI